MEKKKKSVLDDLNEAFEYGPSLSLPQICYAIIAVNDLRSNGKINSFVAHCIICNLVNDLNNILDRTQKQFHEQLKKSDDD